MPTRYHEIFLPVQLPAVADNVAFYLPFLFPFTLCMEYGTQSAVVEFPPSMSLEWLSRHTTSIAKLRSSSSLDLDSVTYIKLYIPHVHFPKLPLLSFL